MHYNNKIRPFLKWAGNKYRCIEHIIHQFPKAKRLIEPFTGSASIFLNSQFDEYILGEHNPHLVNLYQHLQQEQDEFINFCKTWFEPQYNQKEIYYELRKLFNQTDDTRLKSALFLYLNRHGFNGLCRFNLKGIYNVPFGSYTKPYFPAIELAKFLEKAHQAEFINKDYQETFQYARQGDVIYCDPPYHPLNKTANFTAYSANSFKETDQIRLAELAMHASMKGCHVFVSNHDTAFTRNLYHNASLIRSFEVSRTISCQGNQRQAVKEILVYYKPGPGLVDGNC
jgi:DNA adenine methylase